MGFILEKDASNKYKVNHYLKTTVEMPNSIPFLRDPRSVDNKHIRKLNTLELGPTVGGSMPRKGRKLAVARDLYMRKMKESGWQQHIKPISKINERVHASQRTDFEKI